MEKLRKSGIESNELEVRVRERTVELAKKNEEALETLARGIAHDFNNILMPIVINTELAILDTPEGSPILNYLKLVQEAANRGKELVQQIITFSRQKETDSSKPFPKEKRGSY
jgi:signal transduction histidine kinase